MYKQILLAADGSSNSVRAAKEAVKIASLIQNSFIEVLYIADITKIKSEVIHSLDHEDIKKRRLEKLRPVIEVIQDSSINHQVKILVGDPGHAIVEYANHSSFDLVVIGSRGLNSLQEFVLGSVSHKVVKRVQCPIIIVK